MHPELFRLGNFPINTYGVLMATAFVVALLVATRLAERDGLPRERIYDLGLWMLLAGLVGSKLLLMVVEPEYRANLRNFFTLDFLRSAGVWYGGFLGAVAVGYFLMKRYGLPWWKTADAFAPGIALGQAIGRQGCFAAGCCWGRPTTSAFGVHFSEAGHATTGVPTVVAQLDNDAQRDFWAQKLGSYTADLHLHPTQLYESLGALAIFGLLIWLHRRKRFDGQVITTYAVLYSFLRFGIEFFRDDPRGNMLGLTGLTGLSTSQLISLLIGISGAAFLIYRRRKAMTGELKINKAAISQA